MRPAVLPMIACALLSACARPQALDDAHSPAVAAAPYPSLLPLDALVAATPPAAPDNPEAAVAARAANLNARAAALRALPEG